VNVYEPLWLYIAGGEDDKTKFRAGGGIGYEEVNKGKKSTKKSKQDNSALLGGLAGLVLGIFLNR